MSARLEAVPDASRELCRELVSAEGVNALSLSARFCTALNTGGELEEEPLAALGAVRRYPSRVRGAALAWHALERTLASPRPCPGTAGAAATE